jgi:receptor-type tyrosine-protein phosphatase gamma
LQSYTLEGLAVYTQYLVSLRVYNPEGSGPETIVVVMTDEGGESLDTSLPIPRMYT